MCSLLKLLIPGIIFIITLLNAAVSFAQTAGPNSAGTGTNVSTGGTAWTNPGNIVSNDNNYASVTFSTFTIGTSDALVAKNFGFSIPASATIDSIKVGIERVVSGTLILVNWALQLTKDGINPVGTNQYPFEFWSATEATFTYSDNISLWGTTWTPAEIISSTFGVYLSVGTIAFGGATARVDNISVTVYYSIPTPVDLISFEGSVLENAIELRWKTAWEENNDFFTIEKSTNGINYVKLTDIPGNGSTEILSKYIYIDPLPSKGFNYYRLS